MASLRKRHRETTDELPPERDLVPALAEEAAAASHKPNDVAADISSPAAADAAAPVRPVEDEEKTAMRKRLQEMEAAQARVQQLEAEIAARTQITHQLQQAPQQPDDPVEVALAQCGLPPRAQQWLRQHPEYIFDQEKNAELQFRHWQARREAGEDFSDRYYECMERMLGLSSTEIRDTPQPAPTDEAPPMNEPMPRRISIPAFASEPRPEPPAPAPAPRVGPPVSAPPHREPISLGNGRRLSQSSVRLSADQREIAAQIAASKGISQQEAEEEMALNVLKLQRLKASGAIQD
jgi:hypothetical protein